jgi:RNA polymerase sigma-70 factor (ECF subfamily)
MLVIQSMRAVFAAAASSIKQNPRSRRTVAEVADLGPYGPLQSPGRRPAATTNISDQLDKISGWRRLNYKDREKVMETVATDEEWRVCFSRLAPGLLLFARQWVRSPADAEDVVQEAFVRFWRRNHSIVNRALLYATVHSIALDFLRRDNRRAQRESNASSEMDRFVQPRFALEDESERLLAAAVDGLPKEQREVLVMKLWNELTFAEIGSVLGISQNTAASRYRYALGALRKNFILQ